MNGIQATEEVRRLSGGDRLPIIAVTAHPSRATPTPVSPPA